MDDMIYPPAQMEAKSLGGPVEGRRLDITLRQNIDEKIKQAEAQVALLKATKERMEKSGILDVRIDDVQRVMRW